MSASTSPHIMQRLPTELVSLVIDRLPLSDAKSLSLVDKEWRELSVQRVFRQMGLSWACKTSPSPRILGLCRRLVFHLNSFGFTPANWPEYLDWM